MKGTSGSVERELAKPRLDNDRDLIAVAAGPKTAIFIKRFKRTEGGET
jgi:hypothetical protein